MHGVEVPDNGAFTLEINVEGLGIDKPFDTMYSGDAIVTITGGVSKIANQKSMVTLGDDMFDVYTSLSNGMVLGIEVDHDFTSVIVLLETSTIDEGELIITLPRTMIDSKINGDDDDFIILLDGEEIDYQENKTTETDRELSVHIFAASEEVEIIGTRVIPEFPVAVMALMGVVIGMGIAVSRFRNKRHLMSNG